jgi:hypothetical protein
MGPTKGRSQIERGLADMSPPAPEPQTRWSPDPGTVEDWPFVLPLLGPRQIIGRQGLDKETRRLSEFSMSAQLNVAGHWYEVARVDTCHEEVHLHVFSRAGKELSRQVLLPICGPKDVDRGYELGEKMLVEGWEEHERRWRRGY